MCWLHLSLRRCERSSFERTLLQACSPQWHQPKNCSAGDRRRARTAGLGVQLQPHPGLRGPQGMLSLSSWCMIELHRRCQPDRCTGSKVCHGNSMHSIIVCAGMWICIAKPAGTKPWVALPGSIFQMKHSTHAFVSIRRHPVHACAGGSRRGWEVQGGAGLGRGPLWRPWPSGPWRRPFHAARGHPRHVAGSGNCTSCTEARKQALLMHSSSASRVCA